MDYSNNVQLDLISKALLGAASASRGKRLELSDYVNIFSETFLCYYLSCLYHSYNLPCSFFLLCSCSSLSVGLNIGSLSLFVSSSRSSFFLILYSAKTIISTRLLRMFL